MTKQKLAVCGGFDGSESSDLTCIRLERHDGYMFTPKYGPDKRPAIWDPALSGGHIPRAEVHAAVDEIFDTCAVERFYCDPWGWQSELDGWALKYGEDHVFRWDMGRGLTRVTAVHAALERLLTDLTTFVRHDDCPFTKVHMANARKMAKPGERYVIGKPQGAQARKIDAAVTSVLCHEAACDARAAGWLPTKPRPLTIVYR